MTLDLKPQNVVATEKCPGHHHITADEAIPCDKPVGHKGQCEGWLRIRFDHTPHKHNASNG